MTDLELKSWELVCQPLPARPYKSARRRAMTLRAFAVLGVLALVTGGLWGLNQ